MGTRSFCGVRVDGNDKLSYNQVDGGLFGIGLEILSEIKRLFERMEYHDAIDELKQKSRAVKLVDGNAIPSDEELAFMHQVDANDVGLGLPGTWLSLVSDTHGSILNLLDVGVIIEANDFIKKSLYYCEWGYILNLDNETFEIYRRFQHEPHKKERYSSFKPQRPEVNYHACSLIKTYAIKDLIKLTHFDKLYEELFFKYA